MVGHIVMKRPNTKFSGNLFKGPRVVSCVQTEELTVRFLWAINRVKYSPRMC